MPVEISRYEEARNRFPEELKTYNAEKAAYEEQLVVYAKEKAAYEKPRKIQSRTGKVRKTKRKQRSYSKLDTEPEPVAPTPQSHLRPSNRWFPRNRRSTDYEQSFCSYHGVIGSGGSAILYAMIPWTAGGDGDEHLAVLASTGQTTGFACQDGGFEPGQRPATAEEKEREAGESAKEKAKFEEKSAQKKG